MSDPSLKSMRDALELALQDHLAKSLPEAYRAMLPMLTYHLGWSGEGAGKAAQGKRVRPMLVLLCCQAGGGDWNTAIPAAMAVELVHNFSLVHDDIQDNSPLRRGRPTVWQKWGIAQAINAGDLLFNLAFSAIGGLGPVHHPTVVLEALQILSRACTLLTGGQFLDLSYENRQDIGENDYWPMIKGKTAALISCSTELGSLCAGADTAARTWFAAFGEKMGLAFQVWDDWLGIWGNSRVTGKPAGSDLMAGKKSLPVIYGLAKKGEFARLWKPGPVPPDNVEKLTLALEDDGVRMLTKAYAVRLTAEAFGALQKLEKEGCAVDQLREYAGTLVNRAF